MYKVKPTTRFSKDLKRIQAHTAIYFDDNMRYEKFDKGLTKKRIISFNLTNAMCKHGKNITRISELGVISFFYIQIWI